LKNSPKILIINSDKAELIRVSAFLSEVFEEYNLSPKYFNKVLLCISEAIINSIEHGNQNDKRKYVTIEISYHNSKIHVEIHDEGEGFNYCKLADPTTIENIKKESGRGIHIIKSLSDSLSYNEKGNKVKLKIECK
jgi:serine/threonine-protein kinase RsbW